MAPASASAPARATSHTAEKAPLYLDVDGTLLKTDLLFEAS